MTHPSQLRAPFALVSLTLALLGLPGCGEDESSHDAGPPDQQVNTSCTVGNANECDDGVACTVDSCTAGGSCLHAPSNGLCPATAVCHPTAGCLVGRICGSPSDCVDNDPCTRDEECDTSTATCRFAPLDSDEDGEVPLVCGGTDCDDARSSVGAGANELCGNNVDDDCNGITDTDATTASDPTLLLNSELNCGACGNACSGGQTCYLGQCVACGTLGAPCCDTYCPNMTSCTGGSCSAGTCMRSGGSAMCATPCGRSNQPCCPGNTCETFLTCSSGTCSYPTICGDAGTAVLYRLGSLTVPSSDDASNGDVVGQNVDRTGDTCGVPDYAGGVDNSFIDLLAALEVSTPLDVQGTLDAALACPGNTPSCGRLDLIVSVATGTNCVIVEVFDGTGPGASTLTGPRRGSLGPSGNFYVEFPTFRLPLPVVGSASVTTVDFSFEAVLVTGTVSASALSNVILGGYVPSSSLETSFVALDAAQGSSTDFDDVGAILANLNDVRVNNMCQAVSFGFTSGGSALTP